MTNEELVLVRAEGEVTTLTINRTSSLNALNSELLLTLERVLAGVHGSSTRVVVVQGAGEKAFVAGADIKEMSDLGSKGIGEYVRRGQNVMRALELLPQPVIAAVQGFALGGGLELALSADLIVASARAKVGQPEVNLGVIPGFGGTQRLIHRCGLGTARRLTLTGEIIDADEALRLGLVDYVFPAEEFAAAVQKIALMVASRGPLAVQAGKRVIRQALETVLSAGLEREVGAFEQLFASTDREEGMKAFLEKRTPLFKGH